MKKERKDLVLIFILFLSLCVFSVSFLLMSIKNENTSDKLSIYSLIAGIIFWTSMLILIVVQIILSLRMKKWMKKYKIKQFRDASKIGIISFFKNTYAIVADVLMVISLTVLVVLIVVTQGTGYICFIAIAIFVFSFSMHCVLNGKVFYYVINKDELLQIVKERANSSLLERADKNGKG